MSIKLNPHQILPIQFIRNNYGLILFHSTGSGKTITSLFMADQFSHDIIIITTKSSVKNFEDDIKKIKLKKNVYFYTYKKFITKYEQDINLCQNMIVIIDEAHHLRNESKDMLLIIVAVQCAYRLILLTATPIINYPSDLSVLINIIQQKDILPTDKKLFDFYFINDELKINNTDLLEKKLKNSISFYENKNIDDYPTVKEEIIRIEMSPEQMNKYKEHVGQILLDKKIINVDTDVRTIDLEINYNFLDKKKKNSFLNATRQLSNVVDKDILTPKIKNIINKLVDNPFPAIVYSNYLSFGIYPIAKELEKKDIIYKIISGSISQDKLKKYIDDYNSRKVQVLLISSAGSESLDLKNTRQIHIMEPHWNDAKIRQVIGRAIRYQSHISLKKKDRNIMIFRWITIFPFNIKYKTADEYLEELSIKKDEIFIEIKNIIIKSSIENLL